MRSIDLTLQRDGLILKATVYGESHWPLIILIHGFPDTPHSWDGVIPMLVNAGYRVLVPWLRGYTAASAKRHAEYGLMPAAQDILAWKDALTDDAVHLVGHDWGAAIAMVLANRSPAAWLSLSLLAVPPIPKKTRLPYAVWNFPKQLRMSSYMLIMRSNQAEYLLSNQNAHYVQQIWKAWSPSWMFAEADFQHTRTAFSNPDIAWAASRYYRSLFSLHRSVSRQGAAHLMCPVTLPTLALAGLDDGCMNIDLHKQLAQPQGYSGQIRSVYLPDCGHFLQAEQPEAVGRELLSHIEQSQVSHRSAETTL
jgi:pimeloyl-ACP methyl ester carboxylesterase